MKVLSNAYSSAPTAFLVSVLSCGSSVVQAVDKRDCCVLSPSAMLEHAKFSSMDL